MSRIEEFFPELKELSAALPKRPGHKKSKRSTSDPVQKCQSKVRFYSGSEAWEFAHSRGNRAYDCPICGYWHTTSKRVRKTE